MYIERLALRDFRNYSSADIEGFSQGANIIYGKNAQGKTNLLEAIAFLSNGKSFRDFTDSRLIREGKKAAFLRADYCSDIKSNIEAAIFGDKKKSIRINGVPIRKLSELFGNLCAIVFAPEDIKTIKENPGLRRRFIDLEISKLHPSYYLELQRYGETLRSKSKALKEHNPDTSLVDIYNETLAATGGRIIKQRADYISLLDKKALELGTHISGENVGVRYRCCADIKEPENSLLEKLKRNFEREREFGMCLIGVHREDIVITVDEREARLYCSQGQQRTAMLCLKLAAGRILHDTLGQTPVILLDDVFSELDADRRSAVITATQNYQLFITTADDSPNRSNFDAAFEIKSGICQKK